jgi:hypothetical protein
VALTPEQRTLRARMGAHAVHAAGKTSTGPARAAFDNRFLDEVDPDRQLSEPERQKRAKAAKSLFFTRLALKSSIARGKRKADGSTY